MATKEMSLTSTPDHKDTMIRSRSRSPRPPVSGCPSPYFSSSSSQHSSPYPSTPGVAPHWYFDVDEPMHDCPFHIDTCKGCDGTYLVHHNDDDFDRHSVSSALSSVRDDLCSRRSVTPCSSVRSLNSPDANRMHLKEEFLRLYFPAGISDFETDFMYSKFLAQESLQSLSQTMHAAIDTLGLIQLGISHSDDGLIQEAQTRYQAAVTALNRDLEDPNAMYDDAVLGAIYLLGFCEVYEPLCQDSTWRTHHRGLRDLLLARGPQGEYSKFAQLLVYNFRHLSAIAGCHERKTVPFAGKEWRECSAITDGLTTALSEHLLIIPGILEKADKAMERPGRDPTKLFNVLLELAKLEQSMQSWLVQWYSSFEHQPYWQTKVERFVHFQPHCENAPKVFRKALKFPSFTVASSHATYWIGLLQLKQTIYEINRLYQQPILPKSEATLVTEGNECADRLCESVAWLSQPRYGFCGVVRSMSPLHYAFKWYCSQGNLEKMAWCEKIGSSMRAGTSMTCFFDPVSPSPSLAAHGTEGTSGMADDDADFDFDGDDESIPP